MVKKFVIIFIVFFGLFWTVSKLFKPEYTKQELVFWTIQLKPLCDNFMNKNIVEFEKKHPEIKIVWVDIPIAEAQKRTLASILGNNPPDLVNLNPDFSVLLAQKGGLEFFNEKDVENFAPELVKKLRYNGKPFALPFYATSPVTLYNADTLKQCGVKNVPKTYNELLEIAPVLSKCTKKEVLSINLNENDTFARILNKYNVYDAKTINNNGENVFNLFKKMYENNYISKDALTINHREVVEKYMSKNAVFIVVGSNFIKMVEENAADIYKNSAVAPQLTGSNGKFDVALMNLIIPKHSKNKALAKEFALQITNEENQLELAKLTNVLPANKNALKNSYFKNCKKAENARCESAQQLNNLLVENFGYENKKTINDTINKTVENYLLFSGNEAAQIKNLAREIEILQK